MQRPEESDPLLSHSSRRNEGQYVGESSLEDQVKIRRRGGSTASRMCAYMTFGFLFIIAFCLVFLPRTSLRRDLARIHNLWIPEPELERLLFDSIKPKDLRDWSKNYTREAHLAGEGKDLADWTLAKFQEYSFKSEIVPYYTYLNVPEDHGLCLLNKDGSIKYKASLKEDVLKDDPTSGNLDSIPTFHGYSANGNVTAQFVYANYGRKTDFDQLLNLNVDIKGKIVIVRYNAIFRGLKVKHAQELGAIGVVIFSDPTDDLGIDFKHGIKPYPEGPARNPSSVQRGSVMFLSYGPGDPTTPGYPSTINADRKDPREFVPSIPSIPISYSEAIPILKALNDLGPGPDAFNDNWGGILEGVSYNVGPSQLELNLFNKQQYDIKPIYNVIGRMEGILPGQAIVVGNHRDAWISGGASDPNSGSAVLLSVAKAFSELKSKGWRPLRTIILASWDGEEYALLGSTEWGEDKAQFLSKNALAYLNVDVAVSGSYFDAGASPSLNELLRNTTARVGYPKGGSVHGHWRKSSNTSIATLGTGSDYTVFLDHLGIPSIDFGFTGGAGDAVYHYHSNYDSFHWMDTFVDPDWKLHATSAKILGLLTLSLSERAVVDLHFEDYGKVLQTGLTNILKKNVDNYALSNFQSVNIDHEHNHDRKYHHNDTNSCNATTPKEHIECLQKTIDQFTEVGRNVDSYTSELSDAFTRDWPWYKLYKKVILSFKIHVINMKLSKIERVFLHDYGLDNRSWYKHVLFAPDRYLGYGGAVFPGILESLQDGNSTNLIKWASISRNVLQEAIKQLEC